MANVFAKSGRKKSVFNLGKIVLGQEFVDTGLTTAEFKANKVLTDALDKGVIIVGLPDDKESKEDTKDNDTDTATDTDNDGLPDDKESLVEIAKSYGLEFNPQLGVKKLKILITEHIANQN